MGVGGCRWVWMGVRRCVCACVVSMGFQYTHLQFCFQGISYSCLKLVLKFGFVMTCVRQQYDSAGNLPSKNMKPFAAY